MEELHVDERLQKLGPHLLFSKTVAEALARLAEEERGNLGIEVDEEKQQVTVGGIPLRRRTGP